MKKVLIAHHKTKEFIEVDNSISILIEALNQISFLHTLYCCAGHGKEQFYITFKYNLDTFKLLNYVFDYVKEKYKGHIKIEIDIYTLQDGQKSITIRSKTQQGFYCKLSENDKWDFTTYVIHGFTYWLYTLKNNPNLYNCKIGD